MDVLQFLWQHYMEYENGWTPIHMAAAKGHTDMDIIFFGRAKKVCAQLWLRNFFFRGSQENR